MADLWPQFSKSGVTANIFLPNILSEGPCTLDKCQSYFQLIAHVIPSPYKKANMPLEACKHTLMGW